MNIPQPLPQISIGMPAQETLSIRESGLGRQSSRQAPALLAPRQETWIRSQDPYENLKKETQRIDRPRDREPAGSRSGSENGSPAPAPKHILLLGTDAILLHSRSAVLERFGYRVSYCVLNISDADNLTAAALYAGVALVHICQSIEPRRAAGLARRLRELDHDLPVLYTEKLPQREPEPFHRLLPPLLHPKAYVRAVGEALRAEA